MKMDQGLLISIVHSPMTYYSLNVWCGLLIEVNFNTLEHQLRKDGYHVELVEEIIESLKLKQKLLEYQDNGH